jgi:hypothetical protein
MRWNTTEQVRRAMPRLTADQAGRASTHSAPLTYQERCERYQRQNNGRPMTARQRRRIDKKTDRPFYRTLRAEMRPVVIVGRRSPATDHRSAASGKGRKETPMTLWARKNRTVTRSWGCVGCGGAECDVQTRPAPGYPRGEGYCWACVAELHISMGEYRILRRTGR